MLELLQKFNKLPAGLREKVSNQQAMSVIETLEHKYGIELASLVMQVMIKETSLDQLAVKISEEYYLPADRANALVAELKTRLFTDVADYLGLKIEKQPAGTDKTMATPPKSVTDNAKAIEDSKNFFFYAEDEEDIKNLSEKARELEGMANNDQLNEVAVKVLEETDINFGSQLLRDRFIKIVNTNLRGVRDEIETKMALMKRFEGGGLGLDPDTVRRVVDIIRKRKQNLSVDGVKSNNAKDVVDNHINKHELGLEAATQKVPGDDKINRAALRDAPYDFNEFVKKKQKASVPPANLPKQNKEEVKRKASKSGDGYNLDLDPEHELEPPTPMITPKSDKKPQKDSVPSSIKVRRPEVKTQDLKSKVQGSKRKVEGQNSEAGSQKSRKPFDKLDIPGFSKAKSKKSKIVFREGASVSGKVKMEDIKRAPRAMDPIDELRFMDIVTFNRMSDNPRTTVIKIRNKIDLLTEQSYAKRSEGIRAWRESPVNRIYKAILEDSIRSGRPIDAIIKERQKNKKDVLTPEQFEAIMAFNSEMKW